MIRSFWNWIDDRTGWGRLLHELLYENIPGGSRWRYVTGSMLVFAFSVQVLTGLALWMCYSPSSHTAYESVYWIQNELAGGWLLRGIHHFMAQAMVALLPLHLLQVVIDKAYRPPREFNFWTGLILMLITLGLSLTGYLLPWDQKGFWATQVATNLMALAPGGIELQKLLVGGSSYGTYTLTRFFALHAGILPALLVFFLVIHLTLFRRHGITAVPSRRPDQYFWPYQVFKDSVACLLLLIVVFLLVIRFDPVGFIQQPWHRPDLGAHLGPPANPADEYKAQRPEWYFLFLFQFLKKFEENEFLGAIVIPSAVLGYFFLMPIIGRIRIGHYVNVLVLLALLGGIIYLTGEAVYEDYYAKWFKYEPEKYKNDPAALARYEDRYKASQDYLEALERDEQEYARLQTLIALHGIPAEGASRLLATDPFIQGPKIFAARCASCHSYLDENGQGIAGPPEDPDNEPAGAPNLYNFASRQWIRGLLDPEKIVTAHYFGRTKHGYPDADGAYPSGGMVEFVRDNLAGLDDDQKRALEDLVVMLSAQAALPYQQQLDQDAEQEGAIERGREAFRSFGCTDCHKLGDEGEQLGPDLTGYGSEAWLRRMIGNPADPALYGDNNDRMPAFFADPAHPEANLLTAEQLELVVRWLRRDYPSQPEPQR
ncbi:MAG: hypothetical protein KatS3mg109_1538 [Pirellulaceae bacterium]|nr:MAG: hypothetical protein KatS3mg109_1538 [Pirellulaceae bacterium]GIW93289.1 MAG: hypothetical protein KatS3mg110_1330 [Pirellulaceae bacterium]